LEVKLWCWIQFSFLDKLALKSNKFWSITRIFGLKSDDVKYFKLYNIQYNGVE